MNLVVKGAFRGIKIEKAFFSKVIDDLFPSIADNGLDFVHAFDV
jgi:hypothetical protein